MVSHFELECQVVVAVLAFAAAAASGIALVVDTAVADFFDRHLVSVVERSYQVSHRK